MKNYYKTLGVRETASCGDIRARWIQLMRKFHPDRRRGQVPKDRKISEINEAYQVLKHPSTRVEYDLQRAYHRKQRILHLQRLIFPPVILGIFVILAIMYMHRPQRASRLRPIISSTVHPIAARVAPSPAPFLIEQNTSGPVTSLDTFEKAQETRKPLEANSSEAKRAISPVRELEASDEILKAVPLADESSPPTAFVGRKKPKRLVERDNTRTSGAQNDSDKREDLDAMKVERASLQGARLETLIASGKALPQRISRGTAMDRGGGSTSQDRREDHESPAPNLSSLLPASGWSMEDKEYTVQNTSPQPITETEVRKFFEKYRKRYNQRDLAGFLSLFSLEALQNGEDGYYEIRRIYSDFFAESRELQIQLEDTRIKIYEEALISEVFFKNVAVTEARYKVDQTLKETGKKKVWMGDISWVLVRENGALKILFLDYYHSKTPPKERGAESR